MIPRILHQRLLSSALSPEELRLRVRLQALSPGWRLRLWTPEDDALLVRVHFAEHAAAFEALAPELRGSIARYMYLAVYGGFYFDNDYKLLKPLSDGLLEPACVLPIARGTPDHIARFRIGNAVLGSAAGHPFWGALLRGILTGPRALPLLPEAAARATAGAEGLTDFYAAHRERFRDIFLAPRAIFHPPLSLHGLKMQGTSETLGAHLCWEPAPRKGVLSAAGVRALRKVAAL